MHRFYLAPDQAQGQSLVLEDREAHHALHVLRIMPGEMVTILDGQGTQLTCEVLETQKRHVRLEIRHRLKLPRPCREIILIQAIPKAKAMEWIIEKASELGVTRIIPLLTERVVVRHDPENGKTEKWHWVAIDALKQSGNTWLPRLDDPIPITRFTEGMESFELSMVASIQSRNHPSKCFHDFREQHHRSPLSCAAWIGPEGDFTANEMEMIIGSGAHPISLGPNVLRSETAAICAISIINYETTSETT